MNSKKNNGGMFCSDEKRTIRQLKLSAEQRPQQQHPPQVKGPLKSVHLLLMLTMNM